MEPEKEASPSKMPTFEQELSPQLMESDSEKFKRKSGIHSNGEVEYFDLAFADGHDLNNELNGKSNDDHLSCKALNFAADEAVQVENPMDHQVAIARAGDN
eukprot:2172983-Karenia_brevis.AAC.1